MQNIELLINELSWEKFEKRFLQETELTDAFRNLYKCLKAAHEDYKGINITILADEKKLTSFVQEISEWLAAEDKLLISSFRNLVFEKLNIADWTEKPIHGSPVNYYYLPGLIAAEEDRLLNGSSIAEITERKHLFAKENGTYYLLVNLIRSKYGQESVIQIIREELPQPRMQVEIDFIESEMTFKEWIEPYISIGNLLENPKRFLKTAKRIQGKTIYQEIGTGYYWYFDNFHKDFSQKDAKVLVELEVFDKTGLHIGTAEAKEGKLNTENRKKDRKISV